MKYVITIATLFVIGSLTGWVIELFFRRFVSQKHWVNPGFMVGPYIPLYGFGTVALYAVSNIQMNISNSVIEIILRILIIGVMMTLIEFVAGLIFIKGMGLKLWDYSDRWGNVMGIICPLFSLFWLIAGAGYYFLLNGVLVDAIEFINENLIYTFFIGGVVGAMLVDFCYSVHLGTKIRSMSKKINMPIKTDEFKIFIKQKYESLHEGNKKSFAMIITHLKDTKDEIEYLTSYVKEGIKKPSKWWKKNKKD